MTELINGTPSSGFECYSLIVCLVMWVSLRQDLMCKLAHFKTADQEAWMKAEVHVAGLLNDDQILTIENTDQDIKKYETYAARMIDTKTTVLLAELAPRMTTPLKC